MKFKVSVENLQYYLARAASGLSGGSDKAYKFYVFTVGDGLVHITCTNGDIFAQVQTKIVPESEEHPFDVDVSVLSGLLSYAEAGEISFSCDGTRVEVRCGDYLGSWVAHTVKKSIVLPGPPTEPPVDLDKFGGVFVNGINTVKHVATTRIVFKNGFCYAGDKLCYQEVATDFPPEVSFVLLPGAYDVVKFLRMNPGYKLKFAQSVSDLFFYDGSDVFVCPKEKEKTETKNVDDKEDWDGRQLTGKQSYFTAETAVLSRAIMRVSFTSEETSSSLMFEIHEKKLVISGVNSHGNHGEEVVPISLQGVKTGLPFKRLAGWNWFVSALVAANSKAVTVYFDKYVGAVKAEKIKGMFSLRSNY